MSILAKELMPATRPGGIALQAVHGEERQLNRNFTADCDLAFELAGAASRAMHASAGANEAAPPASIIAGPPDAERAACIAIASAPREGTVMSASDERDTQADA